MKDTSSDNVCNSKINLFTTRYTYGNRDKEYVFNCRGRPFVALVSPNFPTPTSSLFDYDLVKSLGLKLTDLQCKKFYFAGNKFRILGQISTTVQCVQNGRSGSNFHLKGLVISDLNKALDTHCVAGHKMQLQLSSLCGNAENVSDDDMDDLIHDQEHHHDDVNEVFNERKCETQSQVVKTGRNDDNERKCKPVKREECRNVSTQSLDPCLVGTGRVNTQSLDPCLVGTGGVSFQSNHVTPGDSSVTKSCYCDALGGETLSRVLSSPPGHNQEMTDDSSDNEFQDPSDPANTSHSWTLTISAPHSELPPHLRKLGHGYCPHSVRTQLPPDTCPRPSDIYALTHSSHGDYDYWSKHASTEAELRVLKKSQTDGKPRVVNVNVDKDRDDMLRVGVWTKLPDPSDYQRRHVLIASLRRVAPDRVCQVCFYMLQHSCPLAKHTATKHCATCCEDVEPKVKNIFKKK